MSQTIYEILENRRTPYRVKLRVRDYIEIHGLDNVSVFEQSNPTVVNPMPYARVNGLNINFWW